MSDPTEADPAPRSPPWGGEAEPWPVRHTLQLAAPAPPPVSTFAETLAARRSVRRMTAAPLREVANLLGFARAERRAWVHEGLRRASRPSPSAGALHPVEVLVVPMRGAPRAFRHVPDVPSLDILRVADPDALRLHRRFAAELAPEARGALLLFVGDAARVGAAYRRPDSLLWRDAGALLQTIHLCATAFRMAFCPLGPLGQEVFDAVLAPVDGRSLRAVGTALVGIPVPARGGGG